MEYHIEAGCKTRRYIESVMPSMLTQLGLNRSRRLLVVKVDPELEEMGTTIPLTGIDTFLVVLKPTRNWITLGVTMWKGRLYKRNYPYLDQPWEIQAFAKQEIVFRRAIEL